MSDCHLFAEAKQDFHGIYPEQRFRQILNAAKAHAGPTDHLILTGDLAKTKRNRPITGSETASHHGQARFILSLAIVMPLNGWTY